MNTLYRIGFVCISSTLFLISCGNNAYNQFGNNNRQANQSQAKTKLIMPSHTERNFPLLPKENSARCSAYLPPEAKAVDSFQLCTSAHRGKNEHYACQDFIAQGGQFRVYFKGGRYPKIIARMKEKEHVEKILWSDSEKNNQLVCNLPPPLRIPASSKFIGAGICTDDDNQSIACAVFRNKVPRRKTILDHMVFYKADGSDVKHTSSIYAGINNDAMPAEFAYQIGLNLLKTDCCQQRGLEYIEQAYQLFPDSTLYRTTYQFFRTQLSNDIKHQISSYK